MIYNSNRIISKLSIVAAVAMLGVSPVIAGSPVGELEVRGSVRIAQQDADNTVNVADTTYGWFSGDRIETHSGQALLSLESGASFGFGKGTKASVAVEEGAVRTALDSGVLLYALDGDDMELVVESGDYRFSTRPTDARALQVSSGPDGAAGMIEVLEGGQVQVSVREGVLSTRDASGAINYQVASGETVAFDGTEPRQVQVQVEAANQDDDDVDEVGFWRRNPALTGLAIAAGGFAAYKVFFDDDDDDSPGSVSP